MTAQVHARTSQEPGHDRFKRTLDSIHDRTDGVLAPCTSTPELNELIMPHVGKVLVPVDFSEHSERALSYATGLAKSFGATLHLVHVYPASAYVAPPLLPGPVAIGQFRDQSKQAFDEFVEHARIEHSVEIDGTLLEGVPHVEILRLAAELEADLIVMGTHGRTGIEHLLLGSIAERVVRNSEVPVITVPRPL